jgi:hypothetical protein
MTSPQARKVSRRSAITVTAIIDFKLRTVAVDGHGLDDIGVIMKASTCAKWSIRATGRVCFGCYVEVNHQQLGGLAAIEEDKLSFRGRQKTAAWFPGIAWCLSAL